MVGGWAGGGSANTIETKLKYCPMRRTPSPGARGACDFAAYAEKIPTPAHPPTATHARRPYHFGIRLMVAANIGAARPRRKPRNLNGPTHSAPLLKRKYRGPIGIRAVIRGGARFGDLIKTGRWAEKPPLPPLPPSPAVVIPIEIASAARYAPISNQGGVEGDTLRSNTRAFYATIS